MHEFHRNLRKNRQKAPTEKRETKIRTGFRLMGREVQRQYIDKGLYNSEIKYYSK